MSAREVFAVLLSDTHLYAVTDDALEPDRLRAAVESALGVGVRLFQFRDKVHADRERLQIGRWLVELVHQGGGLLIVNDRVDLAVAVDADGVHLGQDDLPVDLGREIAGDQRVVGVSASFLEEVPEAARVGADYIGFGAVFPTGTKVDAEFAGLDLLAQACRVSPLPVVGIGGITADRAAMVMEQGAAGVAVVSALFRAADVAAAGRELLAAVAGAQDPSC
ncbi:MAG: thiamine phosphate synthase [Chloroflexi bacterium]|nr:thiamine phosphate synthase [Chloroflexota bacterium]